MSDNAQQVAIVGAGLAGLVAARDLLAAGLRVTVIDKGRSVGGRLATRRIGDATLDHGAQFFTVRTPEFADEVADLVDRGVVYEWCQGFVEHDGYPRYATKGGMNQLAKTIGAGIEVDTGVQLTSVSNDAGTWDLKASNAQYSADAVILTPPIPQTLALLQAGEVRIDPVVRARFDQFAYHPTLALLVVLDRSPGFDDPGGMQLHEGPFSFIADNQAKGVSGAPAVTFHISHSVSEKRWDQDPDQALAELLDLAQPWLGDAEVVEAQLKRWRYAGPKVPFTDPFSATTVNGAPLVFAGDAFATAKVEGAYTSGRAAAAHILATLV